MIEDEAPIEAASCKARWIDVPVIFADLCMGITGTITGTFAQLREMAGMHRNWLIDRDKERSEVVSPDGLIIKDE